jgi:hypothetical protein
MPQLAGEDILASDIQYPRVLSKAASESVTSSVTLQADDDFSFTLTPGLYRIEAFLHASNAVTTDNGDIRIAWAIVSGTMTGLGRSCTGAGPASTNNTGDTVVAGSGIMRYSGHGLATAVIYGITDDAAGVIIEDQLLQVTVTGVFQMQWAQGTSSATPTSISVASRVYITQLEQF